MKKIIFAATAAILMAGGAIAYSANNSTTSQKDTCPNRPGCICTPNEECPDTPGCVCNK